MTLVFLQIGTVRDFDVTRMMNEVLEAIEELKLRKMKLNGGMEVILGTLSQILNS